jgi:hypothetical protein
LKNPERLQKKPEQKLEIARNAENLDALKSDLGKLQRGIERLIDSYSDGAIDKEQFTSRLSRTKGRIADLDAKIRSNTGGFDHGQQLRILVDHFASLPSTLDVALRRPIGTGGETSCAALSTELRSDMRTSLSSSGHRLILRSKG